VQRWPSWEAKRRVNEAMSAARKRASGKKKTSGKTARSRAPQRRRRRPEPAEAAAVEPKWDLPVEPSADPAPPDSQVFPTDLTEASGPSQSKIALPASGLADEILSRADAAAVEVAGPSEPQASQEVAPVASEEAAPRTHNISFFSAPQREEQTAAEATEHLATFFLADEEYGVDVRLVQEIIRVTEITQVPRAPEYIRGVINLRGRIIPVVDLKRKLGLGAVELTRQSRIVVAKVDERAIGLLVDGASQVLRVPVSCIEQAPEEIGESNASYIRGVAKLEARLIILVDLNKALAFELSETSSEAST
jgi:purine-binding chemotaxis protein CheW